MSRFELSTLSFTIGALLTGVSTTVNADTNTVVSVDDKEETEVIEVWSTNIINSALIEDDIEKKQAAHLSDLLRDQAGIDIGGSHSIVQGINIRGVDDLDLNITIDGISQNNNMFHHAGNLLVNADILKAVDINVGTNSVLTGGLSGGVAFETKDGKDLLLPGQEFGARLHTDVASNDYWGGSGTVFTRISDNVDAMLYYTYTDKDNFDSGTGREVTGNEGRTYNGVLKLGWDVNAHNRLVFSYDKYNDRGDYYVKTNFGAGFAEDTNAETQNIDYTRTSTSIAHELDYGDAITMRSTLYKNELSYVTLGVEGNSEHTGYNVLATSEYALGDTLHTLRYGGEGYEQVSTRIDGSVQTNEDTADSHAFYLEDEIQLTQRFSFTPGVRYNYYSAEMESEGANDAIDKSWSEFTFGLEGKYRVTDAWTLSVSATELFQGPGLRESYVDYTTVFDQSLKAETGINKTLGVAYLENDVLGLDRLSFTFNLFETRIEDYIDNWAIGKGRPVGLYANSGDYDIDGFESSISLRKDLFNARLSYSKSDSKHLETGEQLRYEVGDSIALNLGYDLPDYDLNVNWTTLVTLADDSVFSGADIHKAGYQVHNITMQWLPRDISALTVTLGVQNLFDKAYYSHASYSNDTVQDYETGRNFKLSASYLF